MGYRGKVEQQERARALRAQAWTLQEIADELGVARSSVSVWVREVDFEPRARRTARRRAPNALQRAKQAEIEGLLVEGRDRIGHLSERELLVAGTALYAGEGAKRDGAVAFANSDPRMILFFCSWLRRFFEIDEARLRMRVYLHDDLDLEAATDYWSSLTQIPVAQFQRAHLVRATQGYRTAKHPMGCPSVRYACSRTHRAVMGLVHALLSCPADLPG